MEIDRDSWHFKMVKHEVWDGISFCQYARKVLFNVLMFITIFAIFGTMVGYVAYIYFSGGYIFFTRDVDMVNLADALIFVVMNTIILSCTLVYYFGNWYREYIHYSNAKLRENSKKWVQKKPGFFSMWWQSVRDKVCFTVTFK